MVVSRHDHQPARGWQVLECIVDRLEAFEVGDAVKVVEHDCQRRIMRRDAVCELDHRTLERGAGHFQTLQRAAAEATAHAVDRQRHIGPEPQRVVVAHVERDPGDVGWAGGVPRSHCHGFPISRRGSDERERHVVSLEAFLNPWPLDHLRPQSRREQLRLGKRKRFGPSLTPGGCDHGGA